MIIVKQWQAGDKLFADQDITPDLREVLEMLYDQNNQQPDYYADTPLDRAIERLAKILEVEE